MWRLASAGVYTELAVQQAMHMLFCDIHRPSPDRPHAVVQHAGASAPQLSEQLQIDPEPPSVSCPGGCIVSWTVGFTVDFRAGFRAGFTVGFTVGFTGFTIGFTVGFTVSFTVSFTAGFTVDITVGCSGR